MRRFTPKFAVRLAACALSATAVLSFSGCAGISGTAVSGSLSTKLPSGSVHGGQQGIAGAHVYVYAASSVYNSTGQSLIDPTQTGLSDTNGGYVLTNAAGGFSFGGTVQCNNASPGDEELYIVATGGNPSGQVNGPSNSALVLTAPLGPCSSINASTFVNVNEISTMAMATALQQFMASGFKIGAPASNLQGLKNAFASIANLMNAANGSALATTPSGNGVAPQATLNTLGNILASCANSAGPSTSPCTTLFSDTTFGGVTPADTTVAALNIAGYPAYNVHKIYTDLAFATAPFQPALTTEPNDFSLGVTYTGGSLVQPGLLVIDSIGDIWSANCQSCKTAGAADSINEYSPLGVFMASYTSTGIHNTQGLAFDNAGNLWSVNKATTGHPNDEIVKMSSGGVVAAGFPLSNFYFSGLVGIAIDSTNQAWVTSQTNGYIFHIAANGSGITSYAPAVTGIAYPSGVGIDNNGNVWIAATGTSSMLELSSTGTLVSPVGGYTPTGLSQPIGVAINGANDVWTVDNGTNNASELNSSGANFSTSPYVLGLYQAAIIGIDGLGFAAIPNCRAGCAGSGSTAPDELVRANLTGGYSTGALKGIQNAGFNGVGSVAIDSSGSAWVANSFGNSITQVYGFSAPVITPLSSAVKNQLLGNRP